MNKFQVIITFLAYTFQTGHNFIFLKQMENIKNKPSKDFIIMSTSQWSLFFLNVTFKK